MLMTIFAILLALSVPIGITVGIVAITPTLTDPFFPATATYVVQAMASGVDSFPLLAIPMFILSGVIMAKGGVSKKLFDVFAYFLGNVPGGMICAVIATCLFYGAISGSAPATVAAVGGMTMPILMELGYRKDFCAATVAVAGGLGVIIPPSIPFVLYGMSSGASVSKLFTGGIIPGFLIAACLMCYAVFYCVRYGEDKEKIAAVVGVLHERGAFTLFRESFWALLSPVIILGSIYGGIASPTEAATISVFYALLVSICLYKTLKVSELGALVVESVKTYGPLLFILAAASAFAKIMALLDVPSAVNGFITTTFTEKWTIILAINIFLLFVGMVMDTGPAILLLTPILWPIMQALGVDIIHFGVAMVTNLAIGFVTPPMGVNLFVSSRLTGIPVMSIARNAAPYIATFLVALVLIVVFPGITLYLQ